MISGSPRAGCRSRCECNQTAPLRDARLRVISPQAKRFFGARNKSGDVGYTPKAEVIQGIDIIIAALAAAQWQRLNFRPRN
jgi:hypothetical protein